MDFSFERYLDWLSTTRIDLTNPHFAPQKFWWEGQIFRYDMIVRIEDISERVSLQNGVSLEVPEALRASRHHSERQMQNHYTGLISYSQLRGASGTFPAWECFYNDSTIKQVANLYEADFREYGYDRTVNRSS